MFFDYGKYKGIIVSVALFLILDASVLLINFYTSFQISKDAVAVNLAGRQRMLSQRSMKSLLEIEQTIKNGDDPQVSINELTLVANLFDSTLQAFDIGGDVVGAGDQTNTLEMVSTPIARTSVDETKQIWTPFNAMIRSVLNADQSSLAYSRLLENAIQYGRDNNLKLLTRMNDLTVDLENVATSKATRLRIIQTVGIILAVINFFIIVMHFIRQLRESDEKIEAAQKQTDDILNTVDLGLFLVDDKLKISDKHSEHMKAIFGTDKIAGKGFINFIKQLISSKDLDNVERFFKLLFDPSKKQRLLGDLNPLKKVAVQIKDGRNGFTNKYLKFSFTRVAGKNNINQILTSVADITQQVKLAAELENEKNRNEQQIEMISTLLNTEPSQISLFLSSSSNTYEKINKLLEDPSHTDEKYRHKSNEIFALIHGVKGEAASLSLSVITGLCQDFEEKLKHIQNYGQINGNDFLPLAVILDQLMSYDTTLNEIYSKLHFDNSESDSLATDNSFNWSHLRSLTDEIAARQNKNVELITAGLNEIPMSSDIQSKVNSILIQLIRNAISHGIESPSERLAAHKPALGLIEVSLIKRKNGDLRLMFSDNGRGINRPKLLSAIKEKQTLTKEQVSTLSLNELAKLMFSPNVSQQDTADIDSGQGIGLFSIKKIINELNGKLSMKEIPNQGLKFTFTFPSSISAAAIAA